MATGLPPKFLPTLTEVVLPVSPVMAQAKQPEAQELSADMASVLVESIRERVRAELKAELEWLALNSAQAHFDALLPLIDRHIDSAVQELSRQIGPAPADKG